MGGREISPTRLAVFSHECDEFIGEIMNHACNGRLLLNFDRVDIYNRQFLQRINGLSDN